MSTKRKLSTKLGQPMVKASAKPVTKEHINDARAVVSSGGNTEDPEVNGVKDKTVVEISSDSGSDSEGIDSEQEDAATQETSPLKAPIEKLEASQDEEMADAAELIQEEQAEPTFGDLMLATSTTPIDVAAFAPTSTKEHTSLIPATSNSVSLTTVLSQALRTNDTSLLESCLQTPDPTIIRSTIQRLSSPLASTLLSRLAERLHRKPGRSGSLMVWIQWTLVTHGGYLASQKDLVVQLRELNRVIEERARSLNSLLSLKGKLDMLEAQMMLRRTMRNQRGVDEDEVDEGVIYVENSDSEDDDAPSDAEANAKPRVNGISKAGRAASITSSVSEDMPHGINTEMDELSADEDEDVSDLLDDEAEETDADEEEEDEDEVDHSEVDDVDEDEESEEETVARGPEPPKKMARLAGMFGRDRGSA